MKITAALLAAGLAGASFGACSQDPMTMPNDPTTAPSPEMLKLDKDGDGVVSRKEADAKLAKNWDQWDANKDGVIDAAEFAAKGMPSQPHSGMPH